MKPAIPRSSLSMAAHLSSLLLSLDPAVSGERSGRFRLSLRTLFPALGEKEWPVNRRRNRTRKAKRRAASLFRRR